MEEKLLSEGLDQYGFLSADQIGEGTAPGEVSPAVQTVLVVLFPYSAADYDPHANLSRYCRGKDYHTVAPRYLDPVGQAACQALGKEVSFHSYADTGPFHDRYLGFKAGLGVRGMNQMLINPKYGSFCFIACLTVDAPLPCDTPCPVPEQPNCLRCGKCLKACPGQSLLEDGGFRWETCRSRITQKTGDLTEEEIRILKKDTMIFGCDICQTACPLNRAAAVSPIKEFTRERIDRLDSKDLEGLTRKTFCEKYPGRAFTWRGPQVLRRNLRILNGD